MEGNRNILVYGLPIVTLVVLGVMLLPTGWSSYVLYILLLLASIFIIFLVLIQRGKGGGLAGALGGMGGSSAFGTRAGDVFTMITIVAASFWILSAMALAKINLAGKEGKFQGATVRKLPVTSSSTQPDDSSATDSERPDSSTSTDAPTAGKGLLEDKPGKKSESDNNESN